MLITGARHGGIVRREKFHGNRVDIVIVSVVGIRIGPTVTALASIARIITPSGVTVIIAFMVMVVPFRPGRRHIK